MLHKLKQPKSDICKAVNLFKTMNSLNYIKCSGNVEKFVFLCGANIKQGTPSHRRSELIKFAETSLPHCRFFLAEKVFDVFIQELAFDSNLLDLEHELSAFSDQIIIILESESAFTELGAFASFNDLREKIIVVNNLEFKYAKSFINEGPIKAIEDACSSDNIIHYPMINNGSIDGIGEIFHKLSLLLSNPLSKQSRVLKSQDTNPTIKFNRDSIRFIHDVVYLFGPLSTKELVAILLVIYDRKGNIHKSTVKHLAMLSALDLVSIKDGVYKSVLNTPFLTYQAGYKSILATFRTFWLINNPERYYGDL